MTNTKLMALAIFAVSGAGDAVAQKAGVPSGGAWGFRMQARWHLSLPTAYMDKVSGPDHNHRALLAQNLEALFGTRPPRR